MRTRIELHDLLVNCLGSKYVYYQPPETIKMTYPCIIYHKEDEDNQFADNDYYSEKNKYTITVVDKNPDSLIPDKVKRLQNCRFSRCYMADNLNHFVYTIFF